jgi:hypothetical protein
MFDIGNLGTNETVYVLELELDAEGKAKLAFNCWA